jgi:hypothetical protein
VFPRRAFSSGGSISLEGNVAIHTPSITLDNVLLKPYRDVPTIHSLLGLKTFRYRDSSKLAFNNSQSLLGNAVLISVIDSCSRIGGTGQGSDA